MQGGCRRQGQPPFWRISGRRGNFTEMSLVICPGSCYTFIRAFPKESGFLREEIERKFYTWPTVLF